MSRKKKITKKLQEAKFAIKPEDLDSVVGKLGNDDVVTFKESEYARDSRGVEHGVDPEGGEEWNELMNQIWGQEANSSDRFNDPNYKQGYQGADDEVMRQNNAPDYEAQAFWDDRFSDYEQVGAAAGEDEKDSLHDMGHNPMQEAEFDGQGITDKLENMQSAVLGNFKVMWGKYFSNENDELGDAIAFKLKNVIWDAYDEARRMAARPTSESVRPKMKKEDLVEHILNKKK